MSSAAGRMATVVRLRALAEQQTRVELAAASAALLAAQAGEQAERQRYRDLAAATPISQTLWQQRFREEWAAAAAQAAGRAAVAAGEAREQSRGAWIQAAGRLQAIERFVDRRALEQAGADLRREQAVSDDLAAAVRQATAAYQPGGAA